MPNAWSNGLGQTWSHGSDIISVQVHSISVSMAGGARCIKVASHRVNRFYQSSTKPNFHKLLNDDVFFSSFRLRYTRKHQPMEETLLRCVLRIAPASHHSFRELLISSYLDPVSSHPEFTNPQAPRMQKFDTVAQGRFQPI